MPRHRQGLYAVQYLKSNPIIFSPSCFFINMKGGRRGRDRMVVGLDIAIHWASSLQYPRYR